MDISFFGKVKIFDSCAEPSYPSKNQFISSVLDPEISGICRNGFVKNLKSFSVLDPGVSGICWNGFVKNLKSSLILDHRQAKIH